MSGKTLGDYILAQTSRTGWLDGSFLVEGRFDPSVDPGESGQMPRDLYEARYGAGSFDRQESLGGPQAPGALAEVISHPSDPFGLGEGYKLRRVDHEDAALALVDGKSFFEAVVLPLHAKLYPPEVAPGRRPAADDWTELDLETGATRPAAAPVREPGELAAVDQRAEEIRSLLRGTGIAIFVNGKDALKDSPSGHWPVAKLFVIAAIRLYRRLMGTT